MAKGNGRGDANASWCERQVKESPTCRRSFAAETAAVRKRLAGYPSPLLLPGITAFHQ